MQTDDYLELMRFPGEWRAWNMTPDNDFIRKRILSLRPGEERTPEHDRHAAFHYWLDRRPDTDTLEKLANLALIDPDADMGASILAEILRQPHCSDALRTRISNSD